MTNTIRLALTILLATTNSALLHRYQNRGLRNLGDVLLFNSGVSLIWLLVSVAMSGGIRHPSSATLCMGVVYGLVIAGFLLAKMLALSCGNMSLTVMLGCMSLILPTLVGSVAFAEPIGLGQGIGLVVLLAAMAMCTWNPKEKLDVSKKWLAYVALFWLFSGLTGLVMKFHQNSPGRNEVSELIVIGSIVSAAVLLALAFGLNRKRGELPPRVPGLGMFYFVVCGLCSCLYNNWNIRLTGQLPSIVFFPVFNGSVIFLSAVVSRFVFKERASRIQQCGLVLGTLSLMLVGKVFWG